MRNVGIMFGFATVFTKSGEEPKDGSGVVHKASVMAVQKCILGKLTAN